MANTTRNPLLHFLRGTVVPCHAGDESDAQLLRRFAEEHNAEAFTAVVRRHGPMVLGVCRRVLDDANDVEDAFQAAFLVLVRKAGYLSRPQLLANGCTASRTARRSRSGPRPSGAG
jgi:hypothetical protein